MDLRRKGVGDGDGRKLQWAVESGCVYSLPRLGVWEKGAVRNSVLPPASLSFLCVSFTPHTKPFTSGLQRAEAFLHTKQFSVTPAGIRLGDPAVSLSPDSAFWRQGQILQGKASVPHDCPHTPCRCQSQVQVVTCALDGLAISWRFS